MLIRHHDAATELGTETKLYLKVCAKKLKNSFHLHAGVSFGRENAFTDDVNLGVRRLGHGRCLLPSAVLRD